jgi:hypothetical protein
MKAPLKIKTFLVADGGLVGGLGLEKMHPLMCVAGHWLVTPTYESGAESSLVESSAGSAARVRSNR